METKKVDTLRIHKLSEEQYNREYSAGNIEEEAIYLIPDNGISRSNIHVETNNIAGTTVTEIFNRAKPEDITEYISGDTGVIKTLITGDKYSYTGYVYNGTDWAAMDGNYNAENVYFDKDIPITKEVGYITLSNGQGTIPSKGKNLEGVFDAIWSKELDPTKTDPSVSVTLTGAGSYEVGTKVTGVKYSAYFDDGNYTYGPDPTGAEVTAWAVTDTAGGSYTTATIDEPIDVIVTDDIEFKVTATATHTAGDTPKTNKGNNCTDTFKKISEGTKSGTSAAITGYRSFFYGVLDTSSDEEPLTSAIIRNTDKFTNAGKYTSQTFTLYSNENTKRIVIAYPTSDKIKGLSEVILTSAMNTPIKNKYTITPNAVDVGDVNGNNLIKYTTCVYEPNKIDAGEVHSITLV